MADRTGPRAPVLLVANSRWNLAHLRSGLVRGLRAHDVPLAAAVPEGEGDVPTLPTWHVPMIPDGTRPLTELRTLLALIRLMRAIRPAAVASFTPKANIYAGLAARAVGIPFLPNVSGLGTAFIRGGLLLKVQAALYREAFRGVPRVFFQNRDDAALFEAMGLVASRQVRLIPGSGVDCRAFSPRPGKGPKARGTRLLFVGRLLGDKGVRELAEAVRLLRPRFPDLAVTLLGELGASNPTAISQAELDGWVREGLVTHAGRTSDVRPFVAASDAVILPSYREGMPRALLEAAAMGKPLLASDVPGCREIVREGENGLLFAPRSAEALAAAVARFCEAGEAERKAWGAASRAIAVADYDEALVVEAYRDALIALTGSPDQRPR